MFNPEGCGYIVTTEIVGEGENAHEVEVKTYNQPNSNGEIVVPLKELTSYLIKPNDGFALSAAKDESQTSNPHYDGTPVRSDGFIHGDAGSLQAGSVIVVFGNKIGGGFKVKGVGSRVGEITFMQMFGNYSTIAITEEFQNIAINGAESYLIGYSLWKVEVTNNGETELLNGSYGRFDYTAKDGDEVVIYTDEPPTYANVAFSYEGEASQDMISYVTYNYNTVDASSWKADKWQLTPGGKDLKVTFVGEGFANIKFKVNDGDWQNAVREYSYYGGGSTYTATINLNMDGETTKDFNIVFTAEKEKEYTVTLICEDPSKVKLFTSSNYPYGPQISFTQSGQTIKVSQSNNQLKFGAETGWKVTGILVDGVAPEEGQFYDNGYYVNKDCEITIQLLDLASIRTKTAVVFVEDIEWYYLNFQFSDQTQFTLKNGYNFIKYCDEDRPFTFGSYCSSGSSVFYVNDETIGGNTYPCPETVDFQDGDVIKYFSGSPVKQEVAYTVAEDVKDIVSIRHDYTKNIEVATATHFCLPGTEIHIIPASGETVDANKIEVKVNNEKQLADSEGKYVITVGSDPVAISIEKGSESGVEGIAEENAQFDIINLQGIVVKRNATADDLKSMPAGLYIAGGKKVMVK